MHPKMQRSLLAVAVLAGLWGSAASAQDAAKVDPTIYHCTLENERVRLCEVTFKPGQKIALHSHPDRVVYVVQGGKLTVMDPEGKPNEVTFQPGQAFWFTASSHSAAKSGDAELKLIMVELKPALK